ncbi:hypothetical protein CCR75_009310 [Bremia lactucae]|uniref:Protein kinase n=1 Tax=Bremia lactucae TaxID=4779 RepID=A0A976FN60_BRELC|nr:hypothetical protein CCR75_009310 [Bremia lactucae]
MLAMACVGGALSFLVLLVTASSIDSGANWFAREVFDTETCSSTPVIVNLSKAVQCRSCQCSSFKSNNVTRYAQNICNITNAFTFANGVFGENNYIVVEDFRGSKCENLRATTILPASGSCMQTDVFGNIPIIMMLFANGSALIKMFAEKDCNSIAFKSVVLDSGTISSGRCVQNHYKFYTRASKSIPDLRGGSEDNLNSASRDRNAIEGLGVLVILGIIVGAGIVGFLTAIFVWKWRFSRDDQSSEDDRRCVNYTSLQNRKTSTFINSMAELGLSCINVNPVDRPTAAEVLYKIHRILTTEYNRDSCDEGSL